MDALTTILGETVIIKLRLKTVTVIVGATLKTVVPKPVVKLHVKIKIVDRVKHSSSHAFETLELLCQSP